MACVAVFLLLLFAASNATPISSYSCNLDAEFSASGNGVDMTDFSEVGTSLQHCIIDNCTIMRTDTEEKLEIIHTTKSFIIAVPTDGNTSEMVLMLNKKVPCLTAEHNTNVWVAVGVQLAVSLAHAFINVYVVAVHLLFAKELSVFSKLLMSHNIVLFLVQIISVTSAITHYVVPLGSQMACQGILNSFMLSTITFECYSTCILFHAALTMYYSYKCKSEMPKNLYLFCNCYVFGLLAMLVPIMIGYDLYSGNGESTILPSGYCISNRDRTYHTLWVKNFLHLCNKVAQLSLFAVFIFFYCKRRSSIQDAEHREASIQVSKKLIRIGIAMGATVGIARIAWFAASVFSQRFAIIAALALIAQQFVVMISLMCTRKTSRLCRERFCSS